MNEEELMRMVVRLIGDTESYQEMFKKAADEANKLAQVTKDLTRTEKLKDDAIERGVQVTRQVEKASEKYTRELKEMNSLLKNGEITQETFRRATKKSKQELLEASAAIRTVENSTKKYKGEIKQLKRYLDDGVLSQEEFNEQVKMADAAFKESGNEATKFGGKLQMLGTIGLFTLTAPLVGMGMAATKMGSDIDAAFSGVRKTVDAAEPVLQGIKQSFVDAIEQDGIPVDLVDMLGIAETAGQLGIDPGNVVDFSNVVAQLQVTTNMGEEAASTMARLANITNLPDDEYSNLASAFVELGNNTATTEAEIANMMMRIAAAGTQAGMTVAEIAGFSAALSSVGNEAEAGGTAFSKLFRDITASIALGGDELKAFANVSKLSVEDFSEGFRTDAAGAVQLLLRNLGKLSNEDTTVALQSMGVEGGRMSDAMIRAALSIDKLDDAITMANDAYSANTALAAEAEIKYASFASQVKNLWAQIKILGGEFFDIMEPALRAVITAVKGVVNWFAEMSKGTKTIIVGLGLFTAIIPPLLIGIGTLVSAYGAASIASLTMTGSTLAVNLSLGMLTANALIAAGAMWTLVASIAAFLAPVLLVIAAVVAVGVAFISIIGQGDTFGEKASSAWTQVKDIVEQVRDVLYEVGGVIKDVVLLSFEEVATFVKSTLVPAFEAAEESISSTFKAVGDITGINSVIDAVTDKVTSAFDKASVSIRKFLGIADEDTGIIEWFQQNMAAVATFNEELERSKKLSGEIQGSLKSSFDLEMVDINNIVDPSEQEAAVKDLESRIGLSIQGLGNSIIREQNKITALEGEWFSGKKVKESKQQLAELEATLASYRAQMAGLRADGAVTEAAPASAPVLDIAPVTSAGENIDKITEKFQKELAAIGMSGREQEIQKLHVEMEGLAEAGHDVSELRDKIQTLEMIDIGIEVKIEEKKMADLLEGKMKSIQENIGAIGLEGTELELFNLANLGLGEEALAKIKPMLEELAAKSKINKDAKASKAEADKLIDKYLPPQEKFEKRKAELEKLLNTKDSDGESLIDQDTFNAALKDAEGSLSELTDKEHTVDLSVKGFDAIEAGSADALARVEEFMNAGSGVSPESINSTISPEMLSQETSAVADIPELENSGTNADQLADAVSAINSGALDNLDFNSMFEGLDPGDSFSNALGSMGAGDVDSASEVFTPGVSNIPPLDPSGLDTPEPFFELKPGQGLPDTSGIDTPDLASISDTFIDPNSSNFSGREVEEEFDITSSPRSAASEAKDKNEDEEPVLLRVAIAVEQLLEVTENRPTIELESAGLSS